ncbi:hypothetical protein BDF20DRAFT_1002073 [Mycotypha africana]|uniref:uncharacterized protein n=1 Tax=Mycotypha africana TaxID=64632 RepID=UPI0022FFE79F|nr:uncharacterized protein BDF20DRAFT_1002073 [Mycotypha africana]KAI8975618.1 hypothetical protein BDF20DRAFT_1002073 [Mycotypha africana]
MLPLSDPDLDTLKFDIFQSIKSILPYDLPKLYTDTNNIAIQQQKNKENTQPQKQKSNALRPSANLTANIQNKTLPKNGNYCKACKKKFSNQATFDNHLKSAKHIANDKKMKSQEKVITAPALDTKIPETLIGQNNNSELQEALFMLEEASTDSVTPTEDVLSKIYQCSQQLFKLKRPQDTEKSLRLLIKKSSNHYIDPLQQHGTMLYIHKAQIALARLLCIYQQMDDSRTAYLNILEQKFNASRSMLFQLASEARNLKIPHLLSRCSVFIEPYIDEKTKLLDPISILELLTEAGHVFAQRNDTFSKFSTESIAIVLYAIGLSLAQQVQLSTYCQLLVSYLVQVFSSRNQQHRIIELYLVNGNRDPWSLFKSLLLSIEIDDLVRAEGIVASLKSEGFAMDYLDVQFLIGIYKSRTILSDKEDLLQKFEHLQLLLSIRTEPMLLLNTAPYEQEMIMNQLKTLIAINK